MNRRNFFSNFLRAAAAITVASSTEVFGLTEVMPQATPKHAYMMVKQGGVMMYRVHSFPREIAIRSKIFLDWDDKESRKDCVEWTDEYGWNCCPLDEFAGWRLNEPTDVPKQQGYCYRTRIEPKEA